MYHHRINAQNVEKSGFSLFLWRTVSDRISVDGICPFQSNDLPTPSSECGLLTWCNDMQLLCLAMICSMLFHLTEATKATSYKLNATIVYL